MPLAIVIGMAIRFFTTTATCLLLEITLVYMFTTLKLWGKWGPSPPFRDWVVTCMWFPRSKVLFGHILFWMKKDPPLPSLSFWPPHSSWSDPLLGLWQLPWESKVLLTNKPTIRLSSNHSKKLITHQFHFPWSQLWSDWWCMYPE